jgi:hypothetical protein
MMVMSYVLDAMSLLGEDQWMMGTIGDKPKPSGIHARISDFVNHPKTQEIIHSSANKFMDATKKHKGLLAFAVTKALSHAADVDLPEDLEDQVHHHIEHLATHLSISKTMAHGMLLHTVGKLKEMRGIKENQDKDDELDSALIRLHKMLKKLEPQYNPPKEEPRPKPKGEPK